MPRTVGRRTVTLNKTHIVLPNIDHILTSAEQELLQVPDYDLGGLQGIDDVIGRTSSRSSLSGFDVKKVTQKLYGKNATREDSTRLWVTGLILGFLLLALIFGYLAYKRHPY